MFYENSMETKLPQNTPNKYLEEQILKALKQRGLVEDSKTPIVFQPNYTAEGYRSVRRWILDNIKPISLTGGGVAMGTAYLFPKVAAVVGSVSLFGLLAPLDRYLYHNPKDVAQRLFRHIERPWREAYDKLEIRNAGALEDLVYMAQTPDSVKEEFPHYNQQVSLGISIARIADYLSDISMSSLSRRYGINSERVIAMLAKQKVGTQEETAQIKNLTEQFSLGHLAKVIDTDVCLPDNPFYVLQKHATNYELALKIANASGQAIGSQLSRGHLIVSEDVGVNAFGYMGMHSSGKDFPRGTVEDDAGASFGTNASRGYLRVGGNAEHRVMDYATGGICVVEGTVQHKAGDGMTDTTWPMVLVSIGGLESAIHNVRDGMIVSLNTHNQLSVRKPTIYRFEDYQMKPPIELSGNALAKSAEIIGNYIADWKATA